MSQSPGSCGEIFLLLLLLGQNTAATELCLLTSLPSLCSLPKLIPSPEGKRPPLGMVCPAAHTGLGGALLHHLGLRWSRGSTGVARLPYLEAKFQHV